MLTLNDASFDSLYYRRLTDTKLQRLHQATLEVLEATGVRFGDEEALEIFRQAGCSVEGDRVRIPSARVEWALRAAPKSLLLYDQTGSVAIRLQGRSAYFGNGSDLLYILDHRTGERREARLADVTDAIRLLDKLEHIDYVMSEFLPRDVAIELAERLQMQAILTYTTKPVVYVTTDLANTQRAVAMAEIVAGSAEALRQRPFAACYINISNPLQHNAESIQKLIWLSRKRLPFVYRPALMTRGISTPVTPAGYLVVNNAAGLAGLVLSQLVQEGVPFIRDACAGGTFDMRHMVGQHSAPELRGFNEDLLHFYGLPGFGIGGTTGSKTLDAQAALEAALTLVTSVQAGAQLIHDVGYMENGLTGSLIQLAVCHEIIGWIKAYAKPIAINDETLALDAIEQVVTTKTDFIGSDNTVRHFKEDHYPLLISRENYDTWLESGGTTLQERAREQVEAILAEPLRSRLTAAQADRLRALAEPGERINA